MKNKRFFIGTIVMLFVVLIILAGMTIVIDPMFHYHSPISGVEYPIDNQRYQNDGILKNFDYQSIIIGTSMTENFMASEWDDLFDTSTVKVSLSGASLKEINERLSSAFDHKSQIEYIVQSLDLYAIQWDKDYFPKYDYPTYLYDDNLFNDTKYLLNKSVLFTKTLEVINYNLQGGKTPDFDQIYNWSDRFQYGKIPVLERYTRPTKETEKAVLTEEHREAIEKNLRQNIIELAVEHPDIDFYLFFPPYSIIVWDERAQSGSIDKYIDIYQYVSEILLEYENIHLFLFDDCFDMVCDLNNYKDLEHYGEWINSFILKSMKTNYGVVTKENVKERFDRIRNFYLSYNYDAIFQ